MLALFNLLPCPETRWDVPDTLVPSLFGTRDSRCYATFAACHSGLRGCPKLISCPDGLTKPFSLKSSGCQRMLTPSLASSPPPVRV